MFNEKTDKVTRNLKFQMKKEEKFRIKRPSRSAKNEERFIQIMHEAKAVQTYTLDSSLGGRKRRKLYFCENNIRFQTEKLIVFRVSIDFSSSHSTCFLNVNRRFAKNVQIKKFFARDTKMLPISCWSRNFDLREENWKRNCLEMVSCVEWWRVMDFLWSVHQYGRKKVFTGIFSESSKT